MQKPRSQASVLILFQTTPSRSLLVLVHLCPALGVSRRVRDTRHRTPLPASRSPHRIQHHLTTPYLLLTAIPLQLNPGGPLLISLKTSSEPTPFVASGSHQIHRSSSQVIKFFERSFLILTKLHRRLPVPVCPLLLPSRPPPLFLVLLLIHSEAL